MSSCDFLSFWDGGRWNDTADSHTRTPSPSLRLPISLHPPFFLHRKISSLLRLVARIILFYRIGAVSLICSRTRFSLSFLILSETFLCCFILHFLSLSSFTIFLLSSSRDRETLGAREGTREGSEGEERRMKNGNCNETKSTK